MKRSISLSVFFCISLLSISAWSYADEQKYPKDAITKWVHAWYEHDPEKFWEVSSKFENRLFRDLDEVRNWMNDRLEVKDTVCKVNGKVIYGLAKIKDEKVGKINFRLDGGEKFERKMVVVTAFITRTYEFIESSQTDNKPVEETAALKVYVVIEGDRFISHHSDEINMGYEFAQK